MCILIANEAATQENGIAAHDDLYDVVANDTVKIGKAFQNGLETVEILDVTVDLAGSLNTTSISPLLS